MSESYVNALSSSDSVVEEGPVRSTIFDDVFRTIAQQMPQLLIPLINEVFQTNYKENEHFEQLRNEHYEKFGKVITDSIIQIGQHIYHIECQSKRDSEMVIRMFEYDISIALEHACDFNEIWEIEFPQSCVLYVRNHRALPKYHEAVVKFADGQRVTYRIPVIKAQSYTVNAIFEKRLLILLPYHILKYEHFLKHNGNNQKKLNQLLDDYRRINELLEETAESEKKSGLYTDMIGLIEQIADYIIPKGNEVRKGIGDIMGGKILKLRSQEIREQLQQEVRQEVRQEIQQEVRQEVQQEVRQEERIEAIQNMIKYDVPKEKILQDYTLEEYEQAKNMCLTNA